MHVRHLSVADFRSWASAELALEPGPVTLVGANGQGKTNLIEALGYLATLSSHRVAGDAPLIRAGAERAVTRAAVVADDRELRVEVEIVSGRANRAKLNGSPVSRVRDVLGVLRTVLFSPGDLAIVQNDPSERRRFLDDLLVARSPRMAGVRSDYERVLKQRAALLKSAGGRRGGRTPDLSVLDVWDGHLADYGSQLLHARLTTLRDLAPHAAAAYAEVAPTSVEFLARYSTSLATTVPGLAAAGAAGEDVPTIETLRDGLRQDLATARPSELDRGVNLVGPHRDDVELSLGELPVRGYASQGESWSSALALRLGSYELLRADALPGGDPVLLLDDVFAVLDADRRDQLAAVAARAEQAVITAAVAADVPAAIAAHRFDVVDGEIRRA